MRWLNGGVPEWSKGTDCKSVGDAFGGSNPPPSTNIIGADQWIGAMFFLINLDLQGLYSIWQNRSF